MYGFLNNLIRIAPMIYEEKQEKRSRLMKKLKIPIHNTIVLLNSDIIRKSPENNEEADNRLRKNWLQHISRTMRIEKSFIQLTLGFGISYLHFKNEEDLNKFLFIKNMEKNRKIIPDDNMRSSNISLSQVLPHLGDVDYMEEGSSSEFYKDHKITIDNFSINRVVAVASEPSNNFPSVRYLVTTTIIQQSTRLTCRYSSLLPDIPYIDIILHIMFYPFVVLSPDKKFTRYDSINIKKKSKTKINYELTEEEINEANKIRGILKDLLELNLVAWGQQGIETGGGSPSFSEMSEVVDHQEERILPKDPRIRNPKDHIVKIESINNSKNIDRMEVEDNILNS